MRKKVTRVLREILAGPEIIIAPGAFNALTAKVIEQVGFRVVYATGAGIANSLLGQPDVGLVSMSEALNQVNYIVNATSLPVIADIDNGYGNAVNVYRTVREFEKAGVAGVQIEDQIIPKRCGHFNGKAVVSRGEMISKLRAAVDARQDPDLLIIARTDALAVYGIKEALERARLYIEEGADMTFVEAPRTIEELRMIGALKEKAPQVVNIMEGGLTPQLSLNELGEMGFKLVLYANTALRAGLKAISRALRHLHENGTTTAILEELVTKKERDEITGLPLIEEMEQKYSVK